MALSQVERCDRVRLAMRAFDLQELQGPCFVRQLRLAADEGLLSGLLRRGDCRGRNSLNPKAKLYPLRRFCRVIHIGKTHVDVRT